VSTYTHTRQSWQNPAQPVTGPPMVWPDVDTVVVHYTASRDCPEGQPLEPYKAFLRAMQNDYTVNRGYSLGYSVSVSTVGESWEIRGVDIKPAATKGHNGHTYAILITVDGDAPASPSAVAEVRRLIADAERRAGRKLAIVGHGQLGATSCPGVGIRAQIQAGVFTPVPTPPAPPAPTPEDDPMFYLQSPTPGERPDLIWTAGKVYGIASVADAEMFIAAGAKRIKPSAAQYDELVATSRA
jgi:hypothetical protein